MQIFYFQQDKELFSTIMLRVQELTKCEKDKDLSFRRGQLMSTGAAHYLHVNFIRQYLSTILRVQILRIVKAIWYGGFYQRIVDVNSYMLLILFR